MSAKLNLFKYRKTRSFWYQLDEALNEAYPEVVIEYLGSYDYYQNLDTYTYMATPSFNIDGCENGHFRTYFIAHDAELNGPLRLGISTEKSFGGDILFSKWVKEKKVSSAKRVITGSQIANVVGLLKEELDLVAVDGVSWHFIKDEIPEAKELKVLDESYLIPGHIIAARKPFRGEKFSSLSGVESAMKALSIDGFLQMEAKTLEFYSQFEI